MNNRFDHSVYDTVVDEWHEYTYPYKLGNYDKKLLTIPTCIACLDYNESLEVLQSRCINNAVTCPIITDIECDCHFVAIWIDYQLTSDETSVLSVFQDHTNDFPTYSTHCIKYFPKTVRVNQENKLCAKLSFNYGDCDFKYDFAII